MFTNFKSWHARAILFDKSNFSLSVSSLIQINAFINTVKYLHTPKNLFICFNAKIHNHLTLLWHKQQLIRQYIWTDLSLYLPFFVLRITVHNILTSMLLMFYSSVEKEGLCLLDFCVQNMGGQPSKEIRNFKEIKNKVFVEIRSHLKRFKANKYPVAL